MHETALVPNATKSSSREILARTAWVKRSHWVCSFHHPQVNRSNLIRRSWVLWSHHSWMRRSHHHRIWRSPRVCSSHHSRMWKSHRHKIWRSPWVSSSHHSRSQNRSWNRSRNLFFTRTGRGRCRRSWLARCCRRLSRSGGLSRREISWWWGCRIWQHTLEQHVDLVANDVLTLGIEVDILVEVKIRLVLQCESWTQIQETTAPAQFE